MKHLSLAEVLADLAKHACGMCHGRGHLTTSIHYLNHTKKTVTIRTCPTCKGTGTK